MAAGTRYHIVLDLRTQQQLARLAKARSTPAGQVRRAQVLLARHAGERVRELCRRLRCSSGFVAKVCARFCAGGWAEARRERPRGRPPRRRPELVQSAVEWAQTPPQALGVPYGQWSLEQLRQQVARALPDEPTPACSTLRRWLHEAEIPWWQARSWCTTNDPQFELKERLVCDAYLHAPPQYAVLCYDQAPHLQALSRRVRVRAPRRRQPARQEHDYKRHGTADLHALLDTRSGRCCWSMTWRHDQHTIAKLLYGWLSRRPESHLILILDNLSANHAPAVQRALDEVRKLGKVVLVFRIPTHSSWLNQVERVFADLQRQVLRLLESQRPGELAMAIARWFRYRNRSAKPYNWRYEPDSRLTGTGH